MHVQQCFWSQDFCSYMYMNMGLGIYGSARTNARTSLSIESNKINVCAAAAATTALSNVI